jgi:DNA-binding IclR family transcriptional regulator
MVSKDEHTGAYHLHGDFIRFALEIVTMIPLHERLKPLVAALAQSTGESAAWFECIPTGAVLKAKTEIPDRFHYVDVGCVIGNRLDHGVVQVLMAFLPEPEVSARLQRHGPTPIAEPDYRHRLEEIRHGRVIIDDMIRPGGYPVTRVARPVFCGVGGTLVGVLLVSISAASLPMPDQERLTEAVTSAAAHATEMLGAGNSR